MGYSGQRDDRVFHCYICVVVVVILTVVKQKWVHLSSHIAIKCIACKKFITKRWSAHNAHTEYVYKNPLCRGRHHYLCITGKNRKNFWCWLRFSNVCTYNAIPIEEKGNGSVQKILKIALKTYWIYVCRLQNNIVKIVQLQVVISFLSFRFLFLFKKNTSFLCEFSSFLFIFLLFSYCRFDWWFAFFYNKKTMKIYSETKTNKCTTSNPFFFNKNRNRNKKNSILGTKTWYLRFVWIE